MLTLLAGCASAPAADADADAATLVRFAAFNTSMAAEGTAEEPAYLAAADPDGPLFAKARAVAGVLHAVRPDVVLLSEFDDAGDGESISRFLAAPRRGDAGGRRSRCATPRRGTRR